jgi:hypothetical protein
MYEQEKAAKEAAYNQLRGMQAPQAGYGSGLQTATGPMPKEPTISDRLRETLGYLQELAEIQNSMRLSFVGPEPTDPALVGKNPLEPPIEHLLAEICQRAAMCVSEARALRNRL